MACRRQKMFSTNFPQTAPLLLVEKQLADGYLVDSHSVKRDLSKNQLLTKQCIGKVLYWPNVSRPIGFQPKDVKPFLFQRKNYREQHSN
jgi:hypothetical protein